MFIIETGIMFYFNWCFYDSELNYACSQFLCYFSPNISRGVLFPQQLKFIFKLKVIIEAYQKQSN